MATRLSQTRSPSAETTEYLSPAAATTGPAMALTCFCHTAGLLDVRATPRNCRAWMRSCELLLL